MSTSLMAKKSLKDQVPKQTFFPHFKHETASLIHNTISWYVGMVEMLTETGATLPEKGIVSPGYELA